MDDLQVQKLAEKFVASWRFLHGGLFVRLNRTIKLDCIKPACGVYIGVYKTDLGYWKPITTRKLDEQVIV